MHSIALSGGMASGKSTVAAVLASQYAFTARSFGQLVREEAQRRGLGEERQTLQDLGQSMFATLGAAAFVDELLRGSVEPVVIDGVRHMSVLTALRERLPGLVAGYLASPTGVLDQRWRDRGDAVERATAGSHRVEHELDELRMAADVVLATSRFEPAAAARLLAASAAY
jgi:adenylate kinase family enzyme